LEQIRRREEEIKGKKVKMPKKKRARGEELLAMLEGIKQEQEDQAKLLRNLVSYQSLFATSSSVHFSEQPPMNTFVPNYDQERKVSGDLLEQALADFLQALKATPTEERPLKLQRFRNCLDHANLAVLHEMGAVMTQPMTPPQPPVYIYQPSPVNSYPDIPAGTVQESYIQSPNSETPSQGDSDAIFSSALEEGFKEEKSVQGVLEKPEVDFSFLEFFNPNVGTEGMDLLGDKDVELWNSTLQDFLIFQE